MVKFWLLIYHHLPIKIAQGKGNPFCIMNTRLTGHIYTYIYFTIIKVVNSGIQTVPMVTMKKIGTPPRENSFFPNLCL